MDGQHTDPTKILHPKHFIHTLCPNINYFFSRAISMMYYSRHSESLKYVWKSTNCCCRRKMSSILQFFQMFKGSLCREQLTNLDAKGVKRSVKIWTTNFFKNIYCKWMVGCQKIIQYIRILCPGRIILIESVRCTNPLHKSSKTKVPKDGSFQWFLEFIWK